MKCTIPIKAVARYVKYDYPHLRYKVYRVSGTDMELTVETRQMCCKHHDYLDYRTDVHECGWDEDISDEPLEEDGVCPVCGGRTVVYRVAV